MEKEREVILVPFDFTINSENSLLHALQLAEVANSKILLANIKHKGFFSKPATEEEKTAILNKFKALAVETDKKYNIKPEYVFVEGKMFKCLKDLILSYNVNLVIVGEHYENENHKIASTEMVNEYKNTKLNKNSPLIVTKEAPRHNHYVEIVVPINYQKEFKETLRWVMHLSKFYKCNINFIKPFYTDPEKKRLMGNNMYFTKKMLDNNHIVYGIKTAKKEKKYGSEILRFANDIDADLIVMMADKYREYVLETQPKDGSNTNIIPIMCIKPMPKKFQSFY